MHFITKYELKELSKKYNVPEKEVLVLLANILNDTYSKLFFEKKIYINESNIDLLKKYLARRMKKEPISKIIQKKEFYGIEYKTNRYTLDPRPDTELMVDLFREYYKSTNSHLNILDLGCGTGCIGLTILRYYENAFCDFIDISQEVLNITMENAYKLQLINRCNFILSNWFENINNKYDVIVSNPPYISKNYNLDDQTKYDPYIALFAGNDGLESYKKILPVAHMYLKNCGVLIVEIGFDQSKKIRKIQTNLKLVELVKDTCNIYRACVYKKI